MFTTVQPWKLTWNLKMDPRKRKFLLHIVCFRSAHLSCYPRSALADRKQNVDQNAHMASGDFACRLKYLKYRKLLIQYNMFWLPGWVILIVLMWKESSIKLNFHYFIFPVCFFVGISWVSPPPSNSGQTKVFICGNYMHFWVDAFSFSKGVDIYPWSLKSKGIFYTVTWATFKNLMTSHHAG